MPAKGGNSKKEAGRARKAETEEKKKQEAAAAKEKKEEEKWNQGSKSSKAKEEKEEKRKAELARKQEIARLLAEEEASLPVKPKPPPKASGKKAASASNKTPAGPGAIAAGGLMGPGATEKATDGDVDRLQESFSATGIDDAIDLMEIVNAKTDKASTGAAAAGIERHPERRFKGALEAYTERELPKLKEDHPGLRLNQYKELLYKQFQKSPDNPFNQTTVDYNASKEEKVSALKNRREAIEGRLKTDD